jgi:trigger factor
MSATKKITRLEKSAVRLEVTVPQDELRIAYEKAVGNITRTIQIPGFRKGKVPRNVLERKFGSALKEDVFNTIVGETVKGIIEDETFPKDILPLSYSQPTLEGDSPNLDLENDLAFSVKWDAQPQVAVETWKGFTVEVAEAEVEEEDIARELEGIRERNAIVMDRALDEEARYGDIVTVNYAEMDDHSLEIPGTKRENFVFPLGSLANYYQFDEDIVGMKTGDLKIIQKDFPNDYTESDLAGKTKKISIKVTALKEKKLPDLDDDLAQDVHEKFETLDDLKKEIRENLKRRLEARQTEQKFNAIMEKIIEKTPVDLPESMIEYEMKLQFANLCHLRGMKEELIMQILSDKNNDYRSMLEGQRPNIMKKLQAALIQQKLMEDLNIDVSDDERTAELKAIAERENADFEYVADLYKPEDRRFELDEYLKARKLRETLFKENTVTLGAKQSYVEFMEGEA